MEKFVKFWGDILGKSWMEKVSEQLREQIINAKEFIIIKETHDKETKKRKNWTAPGIDSIQSFCSKRLKLARRALKRVIEPAKTTMT